MAASKVAQNSALMHGWYHVQAAVIERRIDQGRPAGYDEMAVAVGQGIAGVLAPWHFAPAPARQLGPDAAYG